MTGKFMSVDKANPANVKDEVTTSQNNSIVTPKTLEMMTEDEVEQIMAERRRKEDRAEWGKNQFDDDRPPSAGDRLWP
jgi:hypothetical protein